VARNILGELPEREFERFHSTCIMWCGALDKPIVCDTPCCNVDILPTVLNLLGLPYDSRLLSGTDIFSDGPHVAVLANKSFVSDTMKYNAMNGEVTMLDESALQDESARSAYLERINGDIMARYAAALAINRTDFYRFVWEKSGLMAAG
jgi:lipoteichoic acid synthase